MEGIELLKIVKRGGVEHGKTARWSSRGLSSFRVKQNSNCEGSDGSSVVSSTSALTRLASRRKVEEKREGRKGESVASFVALALL